VTRDEFVSAVSALIKNNDISGAGIRASTLGNLVLRSLPEHWTQHGFPKLKDLLVEIERRGDARLGQAVPGGFAVWAKKGPAQNQPPARPQSARRLRKHAWAAFVNALPRGRRFLERRTGQVLMAQTEPPGNGWMEIQPVPDETQKAWVRELAESLHISIEDFMDSPTWFVQLTDRMSHARPDFLVQWNVLKSARVADHVKKWCDQNHVDTAAVFDVPTQPIIQDPPDAVRRQILDALGRMSTEELLEIPIPTKYVFGESTRSDR
jgi:hypothetical protein